MVLGVAFGWICGKTLEWANRQSYADHHSIITIGLALSLTVLSVVRLMGSDGILAVFCRR